MAFIKIATFNSRLEAETIGHALDEHDIPHMVKMDDAGGMLVDMMGGTAALWVPEDQADRVRSLLDCVFRPPDTE